MADFRLVEEHDTETENIQLIGKNLAEYNDAAVGFNDAQRVVVLLRDSEDRIVAGLYGSTFWNTFEISLLWVREDLRGRGYGTQLLEAAEREARSRGCAQAMLDTFSFQSPRFYRNHGYEEFGQIDGFAGEHSRYYFKKTLA